MTLFKSTSLHPQPKSVASIIPCRCRHLQGKRMVTTKRPTPSISFSCERWTYCNSARRRNPHLLGHTPHFAGKTLRLHGHARLLHQARYRFWILLVVRRLLDDLSQRDTREGGGAIRMGKSRMNRVCTLSMKTRCLHDDIVRSSGRLK